MAHGVMDFSKVEAKRAAWWYAVSLSIFLGLLLVAVIAGPPLVVLASYKVNDQTVTWSMAYALYELHALVNFDIAAMFSVVGGWLVGDDVVGIVSGYTLLLTPIGGGFLHAVLCPFDFFAKPYGDARYATKKDIDAMGLRMTGVPGKAQGYMIILGVDPYTDQYLALPTTVSCLSLAPPGAGKTTGIVVPTLLKCTVDPASGAPVSFIVNDVKPELSHIVGGYLSQTADVWVLELGATDKIKEGVFYPRWNYLSRSALPPYGGDRETYLENMCAIYHPDPTGSADPFWPKAARAASVGLHHYTVSKVQRANLHDTLKNAIHRAMDAQGVSGPHQGVVLAMYDAEAIIEEMNYCGYYGVHRVKVEQGTPISLAEVDASPVGAWDGIPVKWRPAARSASVQVEPSMPMMLDMLVEIRKGGADPNAPAGQDPSKAVWQKMIDECERFQYHPRAVAELVELRDLAEQTRSSIFKQFDSAVSVFKNSAVQQRTYSSDFSFSDIRGRWDPVSKSCRAQAVFLAVRVKDATTMSTVTGLYVESLTGYLIANKPNGVKPWTEYHLAREEFERLRDSGAAEADVEAARNVMLGKKKKLRCDDRGIPVGPCHVLFGLDEFPILPKSEALLRGPEVGRGQKISYLLIGQDFGQIEERYGQGGVERFITNAAGKVVLDLTNDKTAQRISTMVGKTSKKKKTSNWQNDKLLSGGSGGESVEAVDLIPPAALMSMGEYFGPNRHIVLMQGRANRPIVAKTPQFFARDDLKYLVHPEEIAENKGKALIRNGDELQTEGIHGYWAPPPMPYFASARRKFLEENLRVRRAYKDKEFETLSAEQQAEIEAYERSEAERYARQNAAFRKAMSGEQRLMPV